MQTQSDYEADTTMAVFRSAEAAENAERQLRAAGVQYSRESISPGRFQVEDRRLVRNFGAVVFAAVAGAVVGAGALTAIGVVLNLAGLGRTPAVLIWLAVAGAAGGAVVGALFGVERSAGYDEDVARTLTVEEGRLAFVVVTRTSLADEGRGSVRRILTRSGAVAFLDVTAWEAQARRASQPTIVDATSVGITSRRPTSNV